MNGYRYIVAIFILPKLLIFLLYRGFQGFYLWISLTRILKGLDKNFAIVRSQFHPRSQTLTPKIWSTIFDQVPPWNNFYQPSPSFGINHPFYGIFTQPESYPSFPPSLSTPYLYRLEHICTYGHSNKST